MEPTGVDRLIHGVSDPMTTSNAATHVTTTPVVRFGFLTHRPLWVVANERASETDSGDPINSPVTVAWSM